jgi:CIC family chloride channel protein
MAAMFAGASRALLTSIFFAFETTLQPHGLFPLLGACIASYFVSFFLMKHGTIMTEKIKRRGVFTPDVYEPDILQRVSVQTVMEEDIEILSAENTLQEVKNWISESLKGNSFETMGVVDKNENLIGTVQLNQIQQTNLPPDTIIANLISEKNI